MVRKEISKAALAAHKRLAGKISIANKDALDSIEKLNVYYTPGVAAVSSYLAKHPGQAREYTGINNSVAVVSDGSAVLGLGNIGPYSALPVMEGKAMLFKQFAGINAYPIVLATQKPAEIVAAVQAIAPSFGGISLEDIAAPQCFGIEHTLKTTLETPVMHDDQHGTAIVVLAGLINAAKVTSRNLDRLRIVIIGAGAAGNAVARIISNYCRAEVLVVDSKGIVANQRKDLSPDKQALAKITNKAGKQGGLSDALRDADVVIGVSRANILEPADIKNMAADPIVFAMANPNPEILPELAKQAGAKVVATGRSDYPNQVNNALAFPGVFRGALDNGVKQVTDAHKLAAAEALAYLVKRPSAENIMPSILDKRVSPAIAATIK